MKLHTANTLPEEILSLLSKIGSLLNAGMPGRQVAVTTGLSEATVSRIKKAGVPGALGELRRVARELADSYDRRAEDRHGRAFRELAEMLESHAA